MFKRLRRIGVATSPLFALALLVPTVSADQPDTETNDRGSRYEDDAWYDVSEWFDGNDYNPTDEALGRWDDERFDYADNQSSTDNDNDEETIDASEFYGEDYDSGYAKFRDDDNDGYYESYSRYYDADRDRLHDSYATYRDTDRDGVYEDYDFSELATTPKNAVSSSQVAQSTQKGLSGKQVKIAGKISETKTIKRLGDISYLVKVDSDDGKQMWVDMGSKSNYSLFKGDSLTAFGPVVKAGNKQVLLATTVEIQGKQRPVERIGRRYSGTIESTRTAKVRGEERLVAKVKTEAGKMMTVDMGNPKRAKQLKQGDQVDVTGVPVKLGDRVILIADGTSL